jgi:hypothetical protein
MSRTVISNKYGYTGGRHRLATVQYRLGFLIQAVGFRRGMFDESLKVRHRMVDESLKDDCWWLYDSC